MRILRLAARLWIGALVVQALLAAALLVARLIVLPLIAPQPRLIAVTPANGASAVTPRATIALRFSEPMNRPSVERALRVEPPVAASLQWDAPHTTLTISPTEALAPDTAYRVSLDGAALGRLFAPLAAAESASFRTAPAPAVVAVSPADGAADVTLAAPVSVRFSRPMVTADALAQPARLPELLFDPPLAGSSRWLDQRTVLFRPDAPLPPGTSYRVTLAQSLADLSGGQLGRDYRWSFTTLAPRVLAVAPAAGGVLDGPRAPLLITLSSPVDLQRLRAGLTLAPPVDGALAAALRPDGTQLITFTPALDWQPGQAYQAALGGPPSANAGLPREAFRWSFSAAPQPALLGRFPGEGQTLPTGRELRLIFSTPVDAERLRDAIQFSPPVSRLQVVVGAAEARIAADLQAATLYTVTLPADLTDRAGTPLGRNYQLRFLTSPAAPALALPQAPRHIAFLQPGAAALPVRRTNLSGLTIDLYRLDAESVVRALSFSESDWTDFQPERYSQPLLRSWSVALSDPLNAAAEDALPVAANDDGALPPGTYYLRIRTPEGPRADTIVVASTARLALQRSPGAVLVWATDVVSGTPRAALPLALYQDGALLVQGAADANGLWSARLAPPGRTLVVVGSGDQPALAISEPSAGDAASAAYRVTLAADQAEYRAGQPIAFGGFVRRVAGAALALAPDGLRVSVSLRRQSTPLLAGSADATVAGRAAFHGQIALDAATPPGAYTLVATAGDASAELPITVLPAAPASLALAARPLADNRVALDVTTPEGLPLAGAVVSWTLTTIPAPLASVDGFEFGDDEADAPPPAPLSGINSTGLDGRARIPPTAAPADAATPLRYILSAHVAEPGGPGAEAVATFPEAAARSFVGLRLPTRLLSAGQPGAIELIATNAAGQPLPGAAIRLEVFRRTWESAPQADGSARLTASDTLVRARDLAAGDDGTARVELALAAGEYRVRAAPAGRPATAAASLWATRPGFAGWGAELAPRHTLVTDRASYRPGDTATLLLAADAGRSELLVTLDRAGEISGTLRSIRAGEPFTVTLTAADAPGLRVALLAPGAAGEPSGARLVAEARLPVLTEARELAVGLAAGERLIPGGTTTLTITTADGGRPAAADLVLAVTHGAARIWETALRTGPDGTATLALELPALPGTLRVSALAASETLLGQGATELHVGPPLTAQLVAPPFLRAGDEAELALELANTAPVTQQISVAPEFTAARVATDPPSASATLAPGESTRLRWRFAPAAEAQIGLGLRLSSAAGTATVRTGVPVLPSSDDPAVSAGTLSAGQIDLDLAPLGPPGQGADWYDLEVVPTRGALASQAVAALAGLESRSVMEEAGLLLLSAPQSASRPIASGATERLAALQNADGGWGWWPDAPTRPFATAAALEALAGARDAGIAAPGIATTRGLSLLREYARDRTLGADMRAYAIFVLSRYDAAAPTALAELAADPSQLGPDGAAFLLLARAPEAARADRATLARLLALAQRETAGALWSAPASSALLRSDVALTALAARALAYALPGDPLVPQARAWLVAHRPVGGWTAAYESARAVAALAPALPETAAGYRIALLGQPLLSANAGDDTVHTAGIARPSSPAAALAVNAEQPLIVGLRARRPGGAAPEQPDQLALLREYLDPLSGRPLDPAALVAGQLVRVRLTLVASGARVFLEIEEPLPAGATLVDTGSGDFEHVARRGDRLLLSSALLAPGTYQQVYLIRAATAGRFAAPAAQARLFGGAVVGRGAPAQLLVAPR